MALLSDLRHALRLLARSPIFSITAVVSLAIGIGASAAIFSLTDALMFEPTAGVRDASEVVDIGRANEGSGFDNMSHPAFTYLRDHSQTVTISAFDFGGGPMGLWADSTSERIFGTLVSANFFDVLGTRAAVGRFFLPDEDRVADARPVAVLSHAFWMRRFNGDPEIVHKTIRLNNRDFNVVGVAEAGFQGSALIGADLWVPMSMVAVVRGHATSSILTDARAVWHVAVGRLKPGVSREQAQAELNTLMQAFKAQEPRANQRHTITVIPASRVPGPVRLPFVAFIGFLFTLTGALVAIACSNVAGMLLARAAARRREMATRLAVGASRGRLIRQLLVETAVLFAAGSVVALPLTLWLTSALESVLPSLPVLINLDLRVSIRVIAFAVGLSLVTAIAFGLAPARHALGGELAPMLHGTQSTVDRKRFRLRNALVSAQVALSLMLVVTAFLFMRTLQAAAGTDPGFEVDNVQIASVDVGLSGFRDQQAVVLADRFKQRLASISGVTSVATARMIALQGGGFGLGGVRVPGREGPRDDGRWEADWDIVSPEYFNTIGMRIVEGRAFAETDREGAPFVAIVNETFARQAWPGQSAIGRTFVQQLSESEERAVQVVGVARNGKYRYISEEGRLFIYVPMAQQPTSRLEIYVKHEAGRQVASDIRTAMAQVEPSVPLVILQSFADATALGLLPQQLTVWIAGSVGTIGVFLAALGLYGLMAFLVAQRTREIAIRMALGASTANMQAMVLRQAARLGLIGGVAGLLLAGAIGTLAQGLLVGVAPIDPIAFGSTALLFAMILALAAWTPARRAANTDPATALRAE